ncbi:MAG: MAPEG family protein [Caulobacteraceae bacterium]
MPQFGGGLKAEEQLMYSPILSPFIALVLWTLVMCGWLYATRIPALSKYKIVYDPRRPSEEFHSLLPPEVRWKADNYNNLMEQPTIFYAVVLALVFLKAGSGLNVDLAWGYVGLRIAHSLVHGLINRVMIRFALFATASLVLLVMTIRAASIAFSA